MSINISLDLIHKRPHYILYWVALKKKWSLKEWAIAMKPFEYKQGTGIRPLRCAIDLVEKYGTDKY